MWCLLELASNLNERRRQYLQHFLSSTTPTEYCLSYRQYNIPTTSLINNQPINLSSKPQPTNSTFDLKWIPKDTKYIKNSSSRGEETLCTPSSHLNCLVYSISLFIHSVYFTLTLLCRKDWRDTLEVSSLHRNSMLETHIEEGGRNWRQDISIKSKVSKPRNGR